MIPEAVILNPRAGGGTSLRSWSEVLEDPWSRSCRLADLPRHEGDPAGIAAWMREQLARGRSRFVACGGDGTLNLVINAALSSPELREGARIGALALGSSNDFHKPFDAPSRGRVAGRAARVAFGEARPHDVGRAVFDEGSRAFAIGASVGVTAEANDLFNRGPGPVKMLKRRWVDGAILASA
ncbi:MAG TPA: diacylglycerol kinase family protein, partial [Bdellovibrionota bacterium]|nr:diacylglycerol kinase family protein [Bdellovibrionota bacterium]